MGNTSGKVPPPLPPKPNAAAGGGGQRHVTSPVQLCFTSTSEHLYDVVNNVELIGDPKPIGSLVAEFSNHLPLCFSVGESMYGICEDRSLMEGQLLSVHFQKEMKVLTVKVKQTGREYTLPVCSSILASPLYNPEKKPETAKRGYTFDNPIELMNASPLPSVVCALIAFTDLDDKLVEKNHILSVENISSYENTNCLLCSSIQTGESFRIGERCDGKFTTATQRVQMPLSKLCKFLKPPYDVTFSSPADGSIALPQSALSGVYTIAAEKEEKSVIVSTKYTSESSCLVETIEILLSVDIDVQLVKLPEKEHEKLKKETKMLYEHFQPSNVSKVICDLDSSINYVQTALYKAIQLNCWNDSVRLVCPKPPGLQTLSIAVDEDEYVDMDNFHQEPSELQDRNTLPSVPNLSKYITTSPPSIVSKDPQHFSTFPKSAKKKIGTSSSPQTRPRQGSNEGKQPNQESNTIAPYLIARRKADIPENEKPYYDYVKFSKLDDGPLVASTSKPKEKEKIYSAVGDQDRLRTAIENKSKLSKYSCPQIVELLARLNLGKYCETFEAECIDGSLFVELDEEVLEKELKIESKLHRLKLLRILDGRVALHSL